MRPYLLSSTAIHFLILGALLFSPWLRRSSDMILIDGFDYVGEGGGGGGGGGLKKSQMGQVVPQPVNVPLPSKPAPVQKAQKAEEKWKVKDDKAVPPKKEETPSPPLPTAEKAQEEKTNIVRRGTSENAVAGEGGFEFGEGQGPGVGKGVGIGFGSGEGGGFGFGSYVRIIRERIWREWTQSAVFGSKYSCIIALTVMKDGEVNNITLEKSSGDGFYDNVALRAVRNSTPLPPLPASFTNSSQRFRINFVLAE